MFTAEITGKEVRPDGAVKLAVSFTDGTVTFTDTIIPSDENGLRYFIDARISALNFAKDAAAKPNHKIIPEKERPAVVDPAAQAREDWFSAARRFAFIKQTFIDTGEKEFVEMRDKLTNSYRPGYLNNF
jgi:hypothetical protein